MGDEQQSNTEPLAIPIEKPTQEYLDRAEGDASLALYLMRQDRLKDLSDN